MTATRAIIDEQIDHWRAVVDGHEFVAGGAGTPPARKDAARRLAAHAERVRQTLMDYRAEHEALLGQPTGEQ